MDFVYKFPAVRGIQAGREYYISMVPLKMIPKLFPTDEEYIAPEYRAQRKLNEARVPIISKYITENLDTYVFSALAASIDGEFRFLPVDNNSDLGMLEVSMDAVFLINDGQHRKAAILRAIREEEALADETISIVFYADKGLARSQQIFTDLNKNAVKTSNSISELYDSRDEVAVITRRVIKDIEFLDTYTDKEKDILGKFSSSLFTLNTFYMANKLVLGRNGVNEDSFLFLRTYWKTVCANMIPWIELDERSLTKIDLRENYIATQGIVIQALGRIGNYFYQNRDLHVEDYLIGLRKINWSRSAKVWKLRAIRSNGRIITNKKAGMLIANVIKQELQIPLSDNEQEMERDLEKSIQSQEE